MFQLSEYMQFKDEDVEEVAFYTAVKEKVGEVRNLANGEYFECLVNGDRWRFLHCTFGDNSWYEIYLVEKAATIEPI